MHHDELLTRVDPSPELPAVHLERAELHVGRVELRGSVSANGLDADVPLSVSLDLDSHAAAELDVAVDAGGPEHLALHGRLALEGPLFDRVDFAEVETFSVDDDHESAEALRSALAAALHLSLLPDEHE